MSHFSDELVLNLEKMKALGFIFTLFLIVLFSGPMKAQDVIAIPETSDSNKIGFALYTVSDNILKLTAQFYPFDDEADFKASLEIKKCFLGKSFPNTPPLSLMN